MDIIGTPWSGTYTLLSGSSWLHLIFVRRYVALIFTFYGDFSKFKSLYLAVRFEDCTRGHL